MSTSKHSRKYKLLQAALRFASAAHWLVPTHRLRKADAEFRLRCAFQAGADWERGRWMRYARFTEKPEGVEGERRARAKLIAVQNSPAGAVVERVIASAAGNGMDALGSRLGLIRSAGEIDAEFRVRIKTDPGFFVEFYGLKRPGGLYDATCGINPLCYVNPCHCGRCPPGTSRD